MKKTSLSVFIAFFLSTGLLCAQAIQPVLFQGAGLSREVKLAATTIAGIVNRETPQLFLANVFETWSYRATDEAWQDQFEDVEGLTFLKINSITDLIDHFSDQLNGAILYDASLYYGNFPGQNFLWQGEIASMLGGLSNSVPVPKGVDQNWGLIASPQTILSSYNGNTTLQIESDLTSQSYPWNAGGLEDAYMTALNWAFNEILPLCNPSSFFLRETTDWAVSQKMFQINLAGNEGNTVNFASLPDNKAAYIEDILEYFRGENPTELFHIYGWMAPEPLVQWFSAYGAGFHESMQANLSWFHVYPTPGEIPLRASILDPNDLELERKYYVLFISSEGDAGNWTTGFQAGAWLAPERGDAVLAWGFNLHFFELFPYLSYYYQSTATENDGMLGVISPLGYTYTDILPSEVYSSALQTATDYVAKQRINSAYAYKHYNGAGVGPYRDITISNYYNVPTAASFYADAGVSFVGMFEPTLATQSAVDYESTVIFNHVNDDTFYSDVRDLNAKKEQILSRLKAKEPPYFYLAGYQRMVSIAAHYNGIADLTIPELAQLQQMVKDDPEIGEAVEFVTAEKFNLLLNAHLGNNDIPFNNKNLLLSNRNLSDQSIQFQVIRNELVAEGAFIRKLQAFDMTGRVLDLPEIISTSEDIQRWDLKGNSGVLIIRYETNTQIGTTKYFIR